MSDPRDPAAIDGGEADPPVDELDEQIEDEELEEDADGDEPVEGDGEEGDEPPEPQQTRRRGPKGQSYGAQIREIKSQLDEANRQLAEVRRQPAAQPPVDQAAARQAEQEFYAALELMPPAQAYQALTQRAEQRVLTYLQGQQAQTNERLDKQAYDAEARTSKLHQRFRPQVEAEVQRYRDRGIFVERETILNQLYATDMRTRAQRAAPAQRNGAARRVAGAQTRPTGARSDGAAGRRPAPGTAEHDDRVLDEARRAGRSPFE